MGQILIVLFICLVIFILFRKIILWYWKMDLIDKNLQRTADGLQLQNKILLAIAEKMEVNPERIEKIVRAASSTDIKV